MEREQTAPATVEGISPRRGVQLPPIQTAFTPKSSQRLQRPRPVQQIIITKDCQLVPPAETDPLSRRASKGGIFGLFGRNKSHRTPKPQTAQRVIEGEKKELTKGNNELGKTLSRTGEVGASVAVQTSLMDQSIDVIPGVPKTPTTTDKQRAAKGAVRSKSFKRDNTNWNPPPLFQAYPQAIKHSSLSAPSLSADAILRHYKTKKNNSHDSPHTTTVSDGQDSNDQDPERRMHATNKRQRSQDAVLNAPWVQKIYVLVTSGYILQYTGEGTFDRLPEKIMPLGKSSAAFASDVIPGKPWVLQVCQEALDDENASNLQGPNSVFKKFSFRNEAKKPANFLLVIDSPEEMNEWLVAVRKEIESLGGRLYRPDVHCRRTSSEVRRTLREKPSRRFLIKRDPGQFADPPWESVPGITSFSDAASPGPTLNDRRPSVATRRSVDSPSVSNTIISAEQSNLDRLRETPRISYASNAKTLSTSPGSSPSHSPIHTTFHFAEPFNVEPSSHHSVTPKAQRTSTNGLSSPLLQQRKSSDANNAPPASNNSRASSSDAASPPHFSVPSYSKRYSVANHRVSKIAPPPTLQSSSIQEPDFPPRKIDVGEHGNRRTSVLGELQPTPRTSPKGSKSLGNLSAYFCHSPPTIALAPSTSPGEIISPKSDAAVPHRFSSLEYSRGISPIRGASEEPPSPPPHPPPTTALPAIPGTSSVLLSPGSHRHSIQPFTITAKQAQSFRRPTSMQVRPRSTVKVHHDSPDMVPKQSFNANVSTTSSTSSTTGGLTSPDLISSTAPIPPPPSRSAPPPPEPPRVQAVRSLPQINDTSEQLMTQLPRLPSIRVSRKGFRGSLEGPWSAGYSNERPDGVRAN
ncbi:MAG: hypothetical protein Q9195_003620 [Heterodermia aff. obscurata]